MADSANEPGGPQSLPEGGMSSQLGLAPSQHSAVIENPVNRSVPSTDASTAAAQQTGSDLETTIKPMAQPEMEHHPQSRAGPGQLAGFKPGSNAESALILGSQPEPVQNSDPGAQEDTVDESPLISVDVGPGKVNDESSNKTPSPAAAVAAVGTEVIIDEVGETGQEQTSESAAVAEQAAPVVIEEVVVLGSTGGQPTDSGICDPANAATKIQAVHRGRQQRRAKNTSGQPLCPNKNLRRPVWLERCGPKSRSAYATPNIARVQREARLFEDQLQAIRAKLRAASYFSGVEDWERLFRRADRDGNGSIDEDELIKICAASVKGAAKGFEVAERDVRALFRHLDKDGNGGIEYQEFEAFLEGRTNFRISEAEQRQAMELLRQERRRRRTFATKSKEIEALETRRKRRGGITPLRPYGWESAELNGVGQLQRDAANKGTLAERRRRPKPINPYTDSEKLRFDEQAGIMRKYSISPNPVRKEWVGNQAPQVFVSRSDGSLERARPVVRLCARSRRGTASIMPHSLVSGGLGLRHWSKGSMCMAVTRDRRPPPGKHPRRVAAVEARRRK